MANTRTRFLTLILVTLAGCQSALNWEPAGRAAPRSQPAVSTTGSYQVKSGDTLYAIAWRHGLDHRDVARWNRLGSGGFITPGQILTLKPPLPSARTDTPTSAPAKRPAAPPVSAASPKWIWPVTGAVAAEFRDGEPTRTGLLLSGKTGDPVRAAAGGKVVYAGSGLIGYGPLLIVKHNETYLSAYGHNQELLVGEGETVTRGQVIARVGLGPERKPVLHFEIRKNGEPVNPRPLLPRK